MKNSDLHTHSYYSDGQISPKNLVRLAKKRGIKNLALTDHNSVKGIKEAIKEGEKIGVNVIPGIEIVAEGGEVLGFFVDIKNKNLEEKLLPIRKSIEGKVKLKCKKIKQLGYDISFKEIWNKFPKARGNINGFYLVYLLYKKGYGEMMKIGEKLGNVEINYKRKKITILQSIKLIKQAGGVPVLAHPWIGNTKKNFKMMKNYIKAGLKGIELNNGDRAPFRDVKTYNKIKKIAKKYNLILTSGSDFHGQELVKQMPGNHNLGKNNCDEKVVEQLRAYSNFK